MRFCARRHQLAGQGEGGLPRLLQALEAHPGGCARLRGTSGWALKGPWVRKERGARGDARWIRGAKSGAPSMAHFGALAWLGLAWLGLACLLVCLFVCLFVCLLVCLFACFYFLLLLAVI